MSTVGEMLASERRRQGKTIADVEAGTKVMARLLDALEHGRYDQLPSPVYVKGYVQSYAKFLGMDETAVLEAYKKETEQVSVQDQLRLPSRAVVQHRDQIHNVSLRTWLIVFGAVVILGLALWALSGLTGDDEVPTAIPPVTTESADDTATVTPGETDVEEPSITTDTADDSTDTADDSTGTAFTMTVEVAEGSASWLRVTVDGLKAYEGTLTGPTTKEWTVNDLATVIVGKPDAVTVSRDGIVADMETADGRGSVTLSASEE